MSAGPLSPELSPSASVAVRPQGQLSSNDCSVAAIRDEITAEVGALPFLGDLRCSHTRVVAGSLEQSEQRIPEVRGHLKALSL